MSIDSIAGVHRPDCCDTIDFVTLPTHSPVADTPVFTPCIIFGATASAHCIIPFPHCFTRFPIGFIALGARISAGF